MLKTKTETGVRLVQQHHHAQISGYLAAHWGGANGFARPGHYPGATDPTRWRDEVILGIAEHDNGWWEWEAMPRISERDGLPVGIGEAAVPTPENEFAEWRVSGFERWRRGVDRLAPLHPYAALLVSQHAYWLYAVAFPDLTPPGDASKRHFVFGAPEVAAGLVGDAGATREFLSEQRAAQEELRQRLQADPAMALAVEPRFLEPHVRLLQLLDSLSLHLALNDPGTHVLEDVPRSSWDDRSSIVWTRRDENLITLDPYPFALDPLPVYLPVRMVSSDELPWGEEHTSFTRLHATPLETVEIQLGSV